MERQRKEVFSVAPTFSSSSISRCRLTNATVALANPSSRSSRNGMSEPMSAHTPKRTIPSWWVRIGVVKNPTATMTTAMT